LIYPGVDNIFNPMNFHILDSEDTWTNEIISRLINKVNSPQTQSLKICLASGNTMVPLYSRLAEKFRRKQIRTENIQLFNLDEYIGVTGYDHGFCGQFIVENLLSPAGLNLELINFKPNQADKSFGIDEYEVRVGDGFDLMLLGLGLNGHLGLNEPGSEINSPTRVVKLHEQSRKSAKGYFKKEVSPPELGITVGMKRIMDAKEVWLLVLGESKADILYHVIKSDVNQNIPASFLKMHQNCHLFADAKAFRKFLAQT